MTEARVRTIETNGCRIFIGDIYTNLNTWISEKNYSSVFILVDENTRENCLPELLKNVPALVSSSLIQVTSGESFKTIGTIEFIWDELLTGNADKKSLLINLGGGVITDMGGFVASTYKRGIDFIHIPTTLLAMADASVGGKTGFDFKGIKNAIGIINEPKAIFVQPLFLKTLPPEQILSGFAEMIKHALISGEKAFNATILLKGNPEDFTMDVIATTISTKAYIVEQDPYEAGVRRQLNFGHTIGHALESWMMHRGLPTLHGFCIAAGMIMELYLSEAFAELDSVKNLKITKSILCLFPSINFQENDIESIMGFMEHDKKNLPAGIGFVLMNSPGHLIINQFIEREKIRESMLYYLSLTRKP